MCNKYIHHFLEFTFCVFVFFATPPPAAAPGRVESCLVTTGVYASGHQAKYGMISKAHALFAKKNLTNYPTLHAFKADNDKSCFSLPFCEVRIIHTDRSVAVCYVVSSSRPRKAEQEHLKHLGLLAGICFHRPKISGSLIKIKTPWQCHHTCSYPVPCVCCPTCKRTDAIRTCL